MRFMKSVGWVGVLGAVGFASLAAHADEAVAEKKSIPTVVVVGRSRLPHVTVEVSRQKAGPELHALRHPLDETRTLPLP